MRLTDYSIERFVAELASDSPAPGGGSVAALCGALGGALVAMVANLTVGREKFKSSEAAMRSVLARASELRAEFLALIEADTAAFNAYMAARKLPKETESDAARRQEALEAALKAAAEVPLRTLEACVSLAGLAEEAAAGGNPNLQSDAGVAALLASATAKAAAYNVRVNLPAIHDREFAEECRTRMASALAETARLAGGVEARMEAGL